MDWQPRPPNADRTGFRHIAFAVDDVEDTSRAVIEAGGAMHGEVVRDPEGNLIELPSWS